MSAEKIDYQPEFEVSSRLIGQIDSTRRIKEEPVLILEKIPSKEDPLSLIFLLSYKAYGLSGCQSLVYDDEFLVYDFRKGISYEAITFEDKVNEIMEKVHLEPEKYLKTKLVSISLNIYPKSTTNTRSGKTFRPSCVLYVKCRRIMTTSNNKKYI